MKRLVYILIALMFIVLGIIAFLAGWRVTDAVNGTNTPPFNVR